MTIAYWCILATIILPYLFAVLGQLPGLNYEGFKEPRRRWPSITGWKARSNSAHINGLEVISSFAAAIIVAHLTQVPQNTIDTLAMIFVSSRLLHAGFYMADFAAWRTISFLCGFACIIALFVVAV